MQTLTVERVMEVPMLELDVVEKYLIASGYSVKITPSETLHIFNSHSTFFAYHPDQPSHAVQSFIDLLAREKRLSSYDVYEAIRRFQENGCVLVNEEQS